MMKISSAANPATHERGAGNERRRMAGANADLSDL